VTFTLAGSSLRRRKNSSRRARRSVVSVNASTSPVVPRRS
jgi:hypothetical protein